MLLLLAPFTRNSSFDGGSSYERPLSINELDTWNS
jgi:hypothetical protein